MRIFAIEQETEQHRQFLDFYYRGQWIKAHALVSICKEVAPIMEKYYDAMDQRLLSGCPKDWQGYYVATSK